MDLVIATRNKGKVLEFEGLASDVPLTLRSLAEFPSAPDPDETGTTFEENAIIKARSAAHATGLWSLADDSGLCVDALQGAPGIRSARYAEGTDETRWQKLLHELTGVRRDERRAAFVCVLALADPAGWVVTTEGRCEGSIADGPRGLTGFGYDPVFIVAGDPQQRTMAQLTSAEKNRLSHRARAFELMRHYLQRLAAGGQPSA
jgi:XTP/dITP diphosphohydrolase